MNASPIRACRDGSPSTPYLLGACGGPGHASRDGHPVGPRDLGVCDRTDTAVLVACRRAGGLIGLWRVARRFGTGPARRMYLGEAEPGADVAELAAETRCALARAGEDPPIVEMFTEGAWLTPYHEAALSAATLIWSWTDAPVRLARAFDGVDPGGGPYFRPDHARLDGPDGERALARLRAGELVLNPPGAMDDLLDPDRPEAVPAGFRSDGRWVWPDAVAYYLKRYRLAPEPGLAAHLRAAPPPGPLSRVARHRVLAMLFAPTGGEPAWQAG